MASRRGLFEQTVHFQSLAHRFPAATNSFVWTENINNTVI